MKLPPGKHLTLCFSETGVDLVPKDTRREPEAHVQLRGSGGVATHCFRREGDQAIHQHRIPLQPLAVYPRNSKKGRCDDHTTGASRRRSEVVREELRPRRRRFVIDECQLDLRLLIIIGQIHPRRTLYIKFLRTRAHGRAGACTNT